MFTTLRNRIAAINSRAYVTDNAEELRDEADRIDSLPAWAAARTLQDLGELTARWLTGDLASQPGYYGRVDVDEVDAPGLTSALVGLNRAGVVTATSQAGVISEDADGSVWLQHAWVSAFTTPDVAARLWQEASEAGFEARVWQKRSEQRTVTFLNGRSYTWAGPTPRKYLGLLYDGVSRDALREVREAAQIDIIDPVPGRNILWAWLGQFARETLEG